MEPHAEASRPRADDATSLHRLTPEPSRFVRDPRIEMGRVADVEWGAPSERADAMLAALERLTVSEWRRVLRKMHDAWQEDSSYASEWDRARRALPAALAALDDQTTFAAAQRRVGAMVARLPLGSSATRAHAILLVLYAVGAELVGPLLEPHHRSALTRFFPLPQA